MEFLAALKDRIPDYAKDIRLNLDSVLERSPLPREEALGCALAAAFAAKNNALVTMLRGAMSEAEAGGALTAASLMGMTNVWYSFIDMADDEGIKKQQAGLRMNAYATHGGVSQRQFEMWALSASLVGKCRFCVSSHVDALKKTGVTDAELKEVGRIAATINAVALILNAEQTA
ncbi:MAG: carboxymuconolactone decarboxylase family protein [Proteobacteria bacterium]|nr:carboxymuconolactone decarboxylase family protein [Pseudomonadota bacterium]MCL2308410.1 carboxymuconolactone decarboxylase family protein [Pseudomonadota bacterium]